MTNRRADRQSNWKSNSDEAHGKVVEKVTSPMTIKGHKVTATKDTLDFSVEAENGKRAARKSVAIKKD